MAPKSELETIKEYQVTDIAIGSESQQEFLLYDPSRRSGVPTEGSRAVEVLRARQREVFDALLDDLHREARAALERWRTALYPNGHVKSFSTERPITKKVMERRGWLKKPASVTYYEKPPREEHVVLYLDDNFYLVDDGRVCIIQYVTYSFRRKGEIISCTYNKATPIDAYATQYKSEGTLATLRKRLKKICSDDT